MTLTYEVTVADHVHQIFVEVPSWLDHRDLKDVREFAISTALLLDSGYLPQGVINAVA